MNRPAVVTLRMSHEMHEALIRFAYENRVSMNQFCVATIAEKVGFRFTETRPSETIDEKELAVA